MKKIFLCAIIIATAGSAAATGQDLTSDVSKASKMAKDYAQVAGAALFCRFEKDAIEEYIVLAQAKINQTAKDREDKIIAKMDFTNSMIVASTRAPNEGCDKFKDTFRLQNRVIEKS